VLFSGTWGNPTFAKLKYPSLAVYEEIKNWERLYGPVEHRIDTLDPHALIQVELEILKKSYGIEPNSKSK